MCKLAAVTGPLSLSQQHSILNVVNGSFSLSQKDGFGFASYSHADRSLAVGRYLDPTHYWPFGMRGIPRFLRGGAYKEMGRQLPGVSSCLVMHGRTSTNQKAIENVHPFINGDLVLAHNGMVSWDGPAKLTPHSAKGCDSEQLLSWLADPGNTFSMAHKVWGGWGAVLLLNTRLGKLTLAKDGASLFIAKRQSKGWVMATTPDDIAAIGRITPLLSRPQAICQRIVIFAPKGNIERNYKWRGFGPMHGGSFFLDNHNVRPGYLCNSKPAPAHARITLPEPAKDTGIPAWEPKANLNGYAVLD